MNDTKSNKTDELVLYQWPASAACDSIYVRCTKIQRVMGLLKLSYRVADISLPHTNDQTKIVSKVKPLMRKIPILKVGKYKYIEETSVIIEYLIRITGYTGFNYQNAKHAAQIYFFEKWVEHWLEWLVIYARWVKDDNYRNFIVTMGDLSVRSRMRKSMDYTRQRACEIVKTTEVGQLNERDYAIQINAALTHLDELLSEGPFLFGPEMKLADLSVFMCVQALSDPALTKEHDIVHGLPRLLAWMRQVDSLTRTPYSRPLAE